MATASVKLSEYNKAWVALFMAALIVAEQTFGWNLGISEEFVTMILTVLTPLLVWIVPNRA